MNFQVQEVFPSTDAQAFKDLTLLDDKVFSRESEAPTFLKGWWWVVKCNGEVAGYCGLSPSIQRKTWGYLCRAAVMKKYRGNGLQRLMIDSGNNLISRGFRLYEPTKRWLCSGASYWKLSLTEIKDASAE